MTLFLGGIVWGWFLTLTIGGYPRLGYFKAAYKLWRYRLGYCRCGLCR